MSLRGFHLLFISIAALFCAGFGLWALILEDRSGLPLKVAGGVTCLLALVLVCYGVSFSRKAKRFVE